jgi:hypothetical protein
LLYHGLFPALFLLWKKWRLSMGLSAYCETINGTSWYVKSSIVVQCDCGALRRHYSSARAGRKRSQMSFSCRMVHSGILIVACQSVGIGRHGIARAILYSLGTSACTSYLPAQETHKCMGP